MTLGSQTTAVGRRSHIYSNLKQLQRAWDEWEALASLRRSRAQQSPHVAVTVLKVGPGTILGKHMSGHLPRLHITDSQPLTETTIQP